MTVAPYQTTDDLETQLKKLIQAIAISDGPISDDDLNKLESLKRQVQASRHADRSDTIYHVHFEVDHWQINVQRVTKGAVFPFPPYSRNRGEIMTRVLEVIANMERRLNGMRDFDALCNAMDELGVPV